MNNVKDLYAAILVAQGFDIPAVKKATNAGSTGGRQLAWVTTVQSDGKILMGGGYIREAGLEPGAECKVEIKEGAVRLVSIEN